VPSSSLRLTCLLFSASIMLVRTSPAIGRWAGSNLSMSEMIVAANVSLVERHDEDCDLSFLKRTAISGELNQRYIAVE